MILMELKGRKMLSLFGNDAILEAQKYSYFSPNIRYCIVDNQSSLIHFHSIRWCGSDSVSGRASFNIDTQECQKISNYEKQYLQQKGKTL